MKEIFLSYDLTLILKEKGFNEPCFAYYSEKGNRISYTSLPYSNNNSYWVNNDCLPVPTHQQVLNWFRKNHGIQLFNDCTYYDGFHYGYKWIRSNGDYGEWWKDNDGESPDGWDTPEEALNEAIKETLKLI